MFPRFTRHLRRRGRSLVLVSVAATLLFNACRPGPTVPHGPPLADAAEASVVIAQAGPQRSDEATLRQVSATLPEFGGAYFDSVGNFVAYLTDLRKAQQALPILKAVLTADSMVSARSQRTGAVLFQQGLYSFGQLALWRDSLTFRALDLTDVVETDLDEEQNRVVVGVTSATGATNVKRLVAQLGIPASAVVIEYVDQPIYTATLDDATYPSNGGVRINSSSGSSCSLGFNAEWGGIKKQVFVTASHCTATQWGSDGSLFYQPSSYIGQEYRDPSGYTSGCGGWFSSKTCRNSDAALVTNNNWGLGTLRVPVNAVTNGWGSLVLSGSSGRILAEDHAVSSGDWLEKIGQTTGWTYGKVKKTCKDVKIGSRITVCSYKVKEMTSYFGDSGGPVLTYKGVTGGWVDFYLAGLVFAISNEKSPGIYKYAYVSSIGQIEADLGSLTTY